MHLMPDLLQRYSVCRRLCQPGRPRQASWRPPVPERLELRLAPAVIPWDGGPAGTGTNWNDPANWAGDALPGANDDAQIASAFAGILGVRRPRTIWRPFDRGRECRPGHHLVERAQPVERPKAPGRTAGPNNQRLHSHPGGYQGRTGRTGRAVRDLARAGDAENCDLQGEWLVPGAGDREQPENVSFRLSPCGRPYQQTMPRGC
jgi:hypothetical protein